MIVIDNVDILLNDDTRKYISLDDKNQYLIIERNPRNLFELVSEKSGEQTAKKFGISKSMVHIDATKGVFL